MRQNDSSPLTRARSKRTSGLGELARFAARINRAIRIDVKNDIVIVTPSDDLETLRYQEMHLEVGRINDLLRHGGFQKLVIDLSHRRRLENIILTALVGFCRSISGSAAFCGVSDEIHQSMQTINVLGLWPIYGSRTEAVRRMNESGASSLGIESEAKGVEE